ncbi:MAG: tetratricopeptide repeat protein, partial [Rhodospirillales bacterium]|nr:tetratricopeptide repeat protein [Rhodospirillales bacterium]
MITPDISDHDWEMVDALWRDRIQGPQSAGRWAEAIDIIRDLLSRELTLGETLLLKWHLAHCLMGGDRDEEAATVIREMIDMAPDDPMNWYQLASCYFYCRGD